MEKKQTDFQKNKTGVTVVTPVFNREDCLGRCIESVIAQNYSNMEHWIVDDGSTDNTSEIIKEYAYRYPGIKYHKFENNRGVNAARNYAIQNAEKEFIVFLDSDDYFVDNAILTMNEFINNNQGYKHYLFVQDDRLEIINQNPLFEQDVTELSFEDFLSEKVHLDFVHVMSADLLKKYPFEEHLRIYEGLNFLRIYKVGERQLFKKTILTKRERNRHDSVTKETLLNNKGAMSKQYYSLKQKVALFEDDYIKYHSENKLAEIVKRIFVLGTALGEYNDVSKIVETANKYNIKIPFIYRLIYSLKWGAFLRKAIFAYSRIKNS
ncbi:MAG: glycosyltransferase family 2 protein [Dysgonamonadaceae bacterium]|jgi:glycosyltransferase involved in cell wall biosynthesis|nr:glycosyltransferase family 2 protein [Dysgonamonadaceae bacterium]